MKTATRNLNILHWCILHQLRKGDMDAGLLHDRLRTEHALGYLEEEPRTRPALLELEYWKLVGVNRATGRWFLTYSGEELVKQDDPDED